MITAKNGPDDESTEECNVDDQAKSEPDESR
jgi:hypothetical protein